MLEVKVWLYNAVALDLLYLRCPLSPDSFSRTSAVFAQRRNCLCPIRREKCANQFGQECYYYLGSIVVKKVLKLPLSTQHIWWEIIFCCLYITLVIANKLSRTELQGLCVYEMHKMVGIDITQTHLEQVKSFKYLGSIVNGNNSIEEEIKGRISLRNKAFYANQDLFNPLNPELNPICYLLALLGAHHFLHVSRIRVKSLTLRLLMSYIYGAPILDVSRSHTTQHSR